MSFQESKYLLGFLFRTSLVLKPPKALVSEVERLITPSYMYDKKLYPDSLSGAAFVVPFGSLECLYQVKINGVE